MYDWPEVQAETDALWAAIAGRLEAAGIAAPEGLDRTTPADEAWESPDLLVGQTCGRPYATGLAEKVRLLGRPTYAVAGAAPGRYCSQLVARRSDGRAGLEGFRGAAAACTSTASQSGWAALIDLLPDGESLESFFGAVRMTGGHRESIRSIAAGAADIATVDCVSWALAERHEPAARELRVIGRSPTYPSLPFIASNRRSADEAGKIGAALRQAVAGLPDPVRGALRLTGIDDALPADYAGLAPRRPAA